MAGLVALGIGILFALPIFACANYCAFADITGLSAEEESGFSSRLEDHLVD